MVNKFNDIFNDYPRLFGEELYLCNEFGKVLTGRGGAGRDLKNAFSLIPREEFYFIKEHMAFAGFRSMILVDSEIGPLLFDLSLSPKFNSREKLRVGQECGSKDRL